MSLSESVEQLAPSLDDRVVPATRRNVRFPTEEGTPPIRFQNALGQSVEGRLINESFGGVAAAITSAEGLALGQELSVIYFGQPTPGIVRRLMPEPGGNWLVAIQWK